MSFSPVVRSAPSDTVVGEKFAVTYEFVAVISFVQVAAKAENEKNEEPIPIVDKEVKTLPAIPHQSFIN